jgi:hypothetical protein
MKINFQNFKKITIDIMILLRNKIINKKNKVYSYI